MEERRNLTRNIRDPSQVSTPVLVFSKLIVSALPVAQMAVGTVYLSECPQQHYIPIYLVVFGVFALVLAVFSCIPCTRESEEGGLTALGSLCTAWNSALIVFLFCWFITGNVWIYSIYPANYNQTLPGEAYCNKTLYLFAFWSTTVVYILLGAALAGCTGVLLCMCVCGRTGPISRFNWNV